MKHFKHLFLQKSSSTFAAEKPERLCRLASIRPTIFMFTTDIPLWLNVLLGIVYAGLVVVFVAMVVRNWKR